MRQARWTDVAILDAIRAWTQAHGRAPQSIDWTRAGADHPERSRVARVFRGRGGWAAALRQAGVLDQRVGSGVGGRGYGQWSPSLILDRLDEWTECHARPPSVLAWNPSLAEIHGYPELAAQFRAANGWWPHSATVVAHFGGWNAAIEAAGLIALPPGVRRSSRAGMSGQPVEVWSAQRCVAAIREWAETHGDEPPRYADWWPATPRDVRYPCASTVARACGSFGRAVRAAGYLPRRGPSS